MTSIPKLIELMISDGAHCSDMYPPRDEDSTSLKAAREFIASKLDSFIQFS